MCRLTCENRFRPRKTVYITTLHHHPRDLGFDTLLYLLHPSSFTSLYEKVVVDIYAICMYHVREVSGQIGAA